MCGVPVPFIYFIARDSNGHYAFVFVVELLNPGRGAKQDNIQSPDLNSAMYNRNHYFQ